MKQQIKLFLLCLAIPLAVGGLSALLADGSMDSYELLKRPLLSPPGWLFPVVWSILYLLMGAASYLILTSDAPPEAIRHALTLYGIQLAVNGIWSILFFRFSLYWLSFFWLVLLWILIWLTQAAFYPISKKAGDLLVPYLAWVTFAGYLNLMIALMN